MTAFTFRALLGVATPCAVAASLALATPGAAQDNQPAAFFDTFDNFDRERWYVSDGWANGDWQNCTFVKEMVDIQDGVLTLGFARRPAVERDYSCGEIQTNAKYGEGVYEVRMKTPSVSGMIAAFFTYIGPVHKKPHDEIDIEVLTRNTSEVSFNVFADGKQSGTVEVPLPVKADEEFVDYAFVWKADSIDWYVNKVLVETVTASEATLPSNMQKMYLSIWGTDTLTDWMGEFTDPGEKVTVAYDWIAFTPLGAPCQFPESLACDLQ